MCSILEFIVYVHVHLYMYMAYFNCLVCMVWVYLGLFIACCLASGVLYIQYMPVGEDAGNASRHQARAGESSEVIT